MALNIKLLRFLLLLFSLFFLPFMVEGQSKKSEIDFQKLSGWGDYRSCVQGCFTLCVAGTYCVDQIGTMVGCSTNKCLCGSKSTYETAIEQAGTCIAYSCDGNESDAAAATTLMTDYCAAQGFDYGSGSDPSSDPTPENSTTSKPSPTSTQPTTTHVDTPPTNQDESKPTTTTTDPSTTKDDSSQTPDESNTKDQPAQTSDSSSKGKGGSDFGTSEIIGTVVGIVSLILTGMGVYIAWRRKRNTAQARGQVAHISPGAAPPPPPPPMHYTYHNVVNNVVNTPPYSPHVQPHHNRW